MHTLPTPRPRARPVTCHANGTPRAPRALAFTLGCALLASACGRLGYDEAPPPSPLLGDAGPALAPDAGLGPAPVANDAGSSGALRLLGLSPSAVPAGASARVTLTGAGFGPGLSVRVGEGSCTSLEILSPEMATCTAPAGEPGAVAVEVKRPGWDRDVLTEGLIYYVPDTPDGTFGMDGLVTTDFEGGDDRLWDSVAMEPDDGIVVTGEVGSLDTRRMAVARYLEDGSLDPTFGVDGLSVMDAPGTTQSWLCDHQLDGAGNIVAVGNGFDASLNMVSILARFDDTGALDPTLSAAGPLLFLEGTSTDHSCQLELTASGDIVIGGHTNTATDSRLWLRRYHPDGTLDVTFGDAGRVGADMGEAEQSFDLALTDDGRVVMATVEVPSGAPRTARLLAFLPDGSPDGSFGSGGALVLPAGDGFVVLNRITVTPDGAMLVTGVSGDSSRPTGNDMTVWRVTADGALDASFGQGGVALIDVAAGNDVAYDAAVQGDGRIVVVGDHRASGNPGDFVLARLTPDGSPDPSFGDFGVRTLDLSGDADRAFAVTTDSRGRLVVTGQTRTATGTDFALLRWWP